MATRGSNRVGQRPDRASPVVQKQDSSGKKKVGFFAGNCRFRLLSPVRLVRRFGHKMVIAISSSSKSKRKASGEGVAKACVVGVAPLPDPHRSEAIEDCIHFINSSSTKQNSVSATT